MISIRVSWTRRRSRIADGLLHTFSIHLASSTPARDFAGTQNIAPPFELGTQAARLLSNQKLRFVLGPGLEPGTPSSSGKCSTN